MIEEVGDKMPTVNLNKKRVLKYLGRKIDDGVLKEKIPMIGTDLENITKDEIIVEIFPNRPDMLSEEGFARALKGFLSIETGLKDYKIRKSGYKIIVDKSVSMRPYTACAIVKNIKFNDERIQQIMQIQEKLAITHGRNRKKSAYGLYPLKGINFPVHYVAKDPKKIKFTPLGFKQEMSATEVEQVHPKGKEYKHIAEGWSKYPFFIDGKDNIMCMLPYTNSEDTGKIDENTEEVFIECTGVDLQNVMIALNMFVTLLADMGGIVYSIDIVYPNKTITTPNIAPKKMILNIDYVNKLLGLDLKPKEVKNYLEMMRFGVKGNSKKLQVMVPCYRTDILHPIDLVEDVAIAYGYENFKEELPEVATIGEENSKTVFARKVAEVCVGLELLECLSYHLTSENILFEKTNRKEKETVRTSNSVNEDYNVLRNSLLPGLMKILSENTRHEYPQKLFEIGSVIKPNQKSETKVEENVHLSVVVANKDANFTEIKAILDAVFRAIGVSYKLKEKNHGPFTPGRSADILIGNTIIGEIGEIHPQVIINFGMEVPVIGFEINLEDVFSVDSGDDAKELKNMQSNEVIKGISSNALFYTKPYDTAFSATVTKIKGKEVVLDKTLFYPEGGGVPSDTGQINDSTVVDVRKDGDQIVHVLKAVPLFMVGDKIKGIINWDRRYKLMRLHTAIHLVGNIYSKLFGKLAIVGSNVSEDKSRVDLTTEKFTAEDLENIEKQMKKDIVADLKIKCWDDGKKKDFRWSQIGDYAPIPCGGLHVKSTKEIGKVKLKKKAIGKGKIRIECI